MQRLSLLLAALWWGGISGVSFLAVPVLFAKLGAPVAGPVAAQLFSLQSWAGILIGLALLVVFKAQRSGAVAGERRLAVDAAALGSMGYVLLAMLLAMLQEFGVAQKIVSARSTGGNLRLWHGVGSAMVMGQWLCAAALVWRTSAPAAR